MDRDYHAQTHRYNRCEPIDVHEFQKREILKHGNTHSVNSGGNFNYSANACNIASIGSPVYKYDALAGRANIPYQTTATYSGRHEIGIEDYYIDFDSATADENSDITNGELLFDLPLLNRDLPIENIIEMEIEREFTIPDIDSPVNVPSPFYFGEVSLYIAQMEIQSITSANNYRAHWKFFTTVDPESPNVQETRQILDTHRPKFVMRRPFISLQGVRFIFGRPANQDRLALPQCIFRAVSVSANPGQFQTSTPHGLTIGLSYAIYISEFLSPNSTINQQVNATIGHMMTVIDTTTLEFLEAINLTGFGGLSARVLIGYRRIMFTIRFRSLTDYATNYISP